MRIVWISNAANSPAAHPDYRQLNWRSINGVWFAELDSYDFRGLSAMITRSIRHESIGYIIGATGEGRLHLRNYPNAPLTWINYVFIDNDEAVRVWLLWNPVLDDPLDLLIYCHRVHRESREPTPELRGHNYLVKRPPRQLGSDSMSPITWRLTPTGGQAPGGQS